MSEEKITSLFNQPMHVLNIGLEGFAMDMEAQKIKVLHIDWSPPAGGNPELAELLSKLGG